jgi:hypothetical protein
MKAHPIVDVGTAVGTGTGKVSKPVVPAAAKHDSKASKSK